MLPKIIAFTVSSSLILFVNHSFRPAYAADCEVHLSRPGASKAKEMAKKRKALKKLEKIEKTIQNK